MNNPPIVVQAAPKTAGAFPAGSPGRLSSIDAYRGFVMFLIMAQALNLIEMAKNFPESRFWRFLGISKITCNGWDAFFTTSSSLRFPSSSASCCLFPSPAALAGSSPSGG